MSEKFQFSSNSLYSHVEIKTVAVQVPKDSHIKRPVNEVVSVGLGAALLGVAAGILLSQAIIRTANINLPFERPSKTDKRELT